MEILLLALVILLLLPNLFVAGFHDIPNALALPVRTRSVTALRGTRLAALSNAAGILLTVPLGIYAFGWFEFPEMSPIYTLGVLIGALITLLGWNIFTYFAGMPTSTTHALLGSVFGACASSLWINGTGLNELAALPWLPLILALLLTPALVFLLGYVTVSLANWISRGEDSYHINRVCRGLQGISVGVISLAIGIQQGQRFGFVVLTALIAAQVSDPSIWMVMAAVVFAIVIGAGALRGGWRIGYTVGHRLVEIDPLRGMAATTSTSALVWLAGFAVGLPVSTSVTTAGALIGAGAHQHHRTVYWSEVLRVLRYWVLTPIVCAAAAGLVTAALSPVLEML